MLKKIIATTILVVSLHAEVEKFQIIANNLDSKDNIIVATGNVVAFSPTYYITAQKVIYNKEKGTFELFDDVAILKNNNVQTKSNYAFMDLNNEDMYLKPSLLYEDQNAIWISSKDSQKKDDVVYLENATLSSCDCDDPDWSIRFSEAEYDTEKMWIDTYNPRIYFKDMPVAYLPYFGFPTDTRRRTGLLVPTLGFSSDEGFLYNQTMYFAPADNYDFEFTPQIRARRGMGLYSGFRYADSPDSMLELSMGYFKEKKKYKDENGLPNSEHYGIDLNYKRKNIFAPDKVGYNDGLFVDINYLNDTEYRDLDFSDNGDDNVKREESKINYVFDTPGYFVGSYFRYYIDTSLESQNISNSVTLQELPKIQAHSYAKSLFLDNLIYSADFNYTNYSRKTGINAQKYDLSVPLSYSMSLFDDYLKLTLKHEFNANKFFYSNTDTDFEDGTYADSRTTVSLNTDLVKPYEDYVHTVNLFGDYEHIETLKEDGDLYSITNNSSELSPFGVSENEDNIRIGINQSLYDRDDLKMIVNHKLSQQYITENNSFILNNIENEITYNYILGSLKNKLVYNHQDSKLTESSTSFSLNYNNYYLSLGHYLSKETEHSGKENLESYQLRARYKLSDKYRLEYYTNYNLEYDIRTRQGLKFSILEDCWNLDLMYEKKLASTTSFFQNAKMEDVLYIELFLKPLGGIKQSYKIKDDRKDDDS